MKRIAQIKKGEVSIGNKVRANIKKNKVAPPFKVAEFEIYFSEGISFEGDLLTLADKAQIVKKLGMTYSYGETKLGGSFQAARDFLKENQKISKEIYKEMQKHTV